MRDKQKRSKFKPKGGTKGSFKGKPGGKKPRGDQYRDKPRDNPREEGQKNFKTGFKGKPGDKRRHESRGESRSGFNKDRIQKDHTKKDQIKRDNGPRPNLYGFHAVREAWLNPDRTIRALYLTEAAEAEFLPVQKKAYELGLNRPSATTIDKQKLDFMLPRGAVHQGIAVIADALDEISIQDFIIKSKTQDNTILVMLDQVTDPHNVGAILRSACAFGADGVIMQRKHAPELEGVLAKTASGAAEHIGVAYETNLSRAIEELKEEGFFVFGLDERGEREVGDIMRNNQSSNHKLVLVLGAEGPGMRRLVKEHCDELVKLPTKGAISSLNVSNAAAVALYALLK